MRLGADVEERSVEWKTWGIERWNERLLEHFFSNHGDEPPVAVLLVTSDELARVTDDPLANANEARSLFLDAVQRAVRFKGLLEDASNYRGWPTQPPLTRPKFVAHLVLTCLAASESSEELADENSFIARLRTLVELPSNSLSMLPTLWIHLQSWLRTRNVSYRALVLPDPGGLKRIGYSVKLTFPDRRDQQRLSQLLDDAGLSGAVPPVGRVLSLVASERTRFSATFQRAFDEFKGRFGSQQGPELAQLPSHRFWAAVIDAALRGRGHQHSESHTHYSILAEDAEDVLSLLITCDQDEALPRVRSLPLFAPYGPWQFGLVPEGEALDLAGLHTLAASVLDGSVRLPRVSSVVDQGVLAFALGSHGNLELADRSQLDTAAYALVHQEKLVDLRKIFPNGILQPSSYPGWVQIRDPGLKTASASTFENTTLMGTWILHESLSLPAIGVRGGVRAEEGWLGIAEVLPSIIADGANQVWMEAGNQRVDLMRDQDGRWLLPLCDWSGIAVLKAEWNDFESQRSISFHSTTVSEAFKTPSDPSAWLVESISNSSSLASSESDEYALIKDAGGTMLTEPILLGAGVGEFVSEASNAAWAVTALAGKFVARRGKLRGEDAVPSFRVDSANARRRWRKLLLKSGADLADPEFEASRRKVLGGVISDALPSRTLMQTVPDLAFRRFEIPKPAVDRLVRVMAARAAARSGIPWREWKHLVLGILAIDAKQLVHVTRAWMEGGFIEVASFARWRTRSVFARSPKLLVYRAGGVVNAVTSGLLLPVSQATIREAATRMELLVIERSSVSPLVPPVLRIIGNEEESFSSLARQASMEIRWIDTRFLDRSENAFSAADTAPGHYESAGVWRKWSLREESIAGVRVEHFFRADRPDFWLATHECGSCWSFELNPLRQWAAGILGEPLVVPSGSDDLLAYHGYLPLSVARLASVLGQGLAGPSGPGEYRYPLGGAVRERILAMLRRSPTKS